MSCVSPAPVGVWACTPRCGGTSVKHSLPLRTLKPETVLFLRRAGSSLVTSRSRRLRGSARQFPNTDDQMWSVYSIALPPRAMPI